MISSVVWRGKFVLTLSFILVWGSADLSPWSGSNEGLQKNTKANKLYGCLFIGLRNSESIDIKSKYRAFSYFFSYNNFFLMVSFQKVLTLRFDFHWFSIFKTNTYTAIWPIGLSIFLNTTLLTDQCGSKLLTGLTIDK